MHYFKELDKDLFLYLNSLNYPPIDRFMVAISSYTWWAIIFIILAFVIYFYGRHKWTEVIFYFLSVGASVILTNIIKLFIKRARPIHIDWDALGYHNVVYKLDEYSSHYSFFSSHSASAFCIAAFTFLALRKQQWIGYLAFVWAFIVGYSRIYVGKHFPVDVFVGMIVGIAIGWIGYEFCLLYLNKNSKSKL